MVSAQEAGQIVANIINEQRELQANISPDMASNQLSIFNTEFFRIDGQLTVTKRLFGSTSFIIDHPIYGELDSSTLSLDGGYTGGSSVIASATF